MDNDWKKWDNKNVTPGDFTVELALTEGMIKAFEDLKSKKPDLKLDEYLRYEFESKLKSFDKVITSDEIKVA